ncbi:hypothetical protein [uncultured Nitrosomonas sp.]|uniref:hypothetical protein n=1 Tax=uncultured Nitrosomonas sp. TaxID=156424 RepID=UPI0025FD51BA|nr:hypothetical protein [uncultured Nitrosomonas sp.]
MNTFADKKENPTTDEYLKASLNDVLDRLNKNPSALQSEEAFVHAVITVRNAMINEKLTKWLIGLTAIVAIATALLVIVPFFTPSFETKKLEAALIATKATHNELKTELAALKNELLESQRNISVLKNQVEKYNTSQ